MKISLRFIIIIIVLLNSCNDNPTSVETISDYIHPLSIGNRWIIKSEQFDRNGIVTQTLIDTLIIEKDTVAHGERWYSTNRSPFHYAVNRKNGVYTQIESPRLSLPYPANVDDSLALSDGGPEFVKVLSINDTVSVGGKTYITYKYKQYFPMPGDEYVATQYYNYAPNIGFIKNEVIANHYPPKKYLLLKQEIISYSIK